MGRATDKVRHAVAHAFDKARKHQQTIDKVWGFIVLGIVLLGSVWIWFHRTDPKTVNYSADLIPGILAILIAFVPDLRKQHMAWRIAIILVGIVSTVVLWKKEEVSDKAQASAIETAVTKANTHSDQHSEQQTKQVTEKIGEVSADLDKLRPVAKESVSGIGMLKGFEPFIPDKPYNVVVSVKNGGNETGNRSAGFSALVQVKRDAVSQDAAFRDFIRSLSNENPSGRDLGVGQEFVIHPRKPITLSADDWEDVKRGTRPVNILTVIWYSDWRGKRISESCVAQWGDINGNMDRINEITQYCDHNDADRPRGLMQLAPAPRRLGIRSPE